LPTRSPWSRGSSRVRAGAAFLGWLRTTWFPYIDCVPQDLRAAFVDEVAAAYAGAHPPDAEGVCHVPVVRLEVEATVA